MKKLLKLILILMPSLLWGQKFNPSYQSNYSLNFQSFLGGVKYAYIGIPKEFEKQIKDEPNCSNAHIVNGAVSYLRAIGFDDVWWGSSSNSRANIPSICEVAIFDFAWRFEKNKFIDIKMSFITCNKDVFKFESAEDISVIGNPKLSTLFHNVFMKMYGYNKPVYSSMNTLWLPIEITEWKEDKLKGHFKDKGVDAIEGIYESVISTSKHAKYKLGVFKTNEGYNLIYFSGANNYSDWQEGEVKAKLFATATPNLFKADWKMANKAVDKNSYITFEQGGMNLVKQDEDKTFYIKLFPTLNDNIGIVNSGPGSGTGFAISSSGLIATNHHVINGASIIKVKGIKGDFSKSYTAKVIADDKNNDIAIIKIDDEKFSSLGVVPYVITSKSIDAGNYVYVLGYPLRATMGDEVKLTNGIVSSKSGFQGDITSYQITAPVQSGNSGGPLFDNQGNIVGIVNAKHLDADNVSYAIKTSYLKTLLETLTPYPQLQSVNTLSVKSLPEKVKAIKTFTYIIETN